MPPSPPILGGKAKKSQPPLISPKLGGNRSFPPQSWGGVGRGEGFSDRDFSQQNKNSEVTVEVIHEILIRNWQTLRWWLDANRDRLRLMREIEQQAGQWQENQQNNDYLLRGTALARGEELYKKYADELSNLSNKYIDRCVQERDRENKIKNRNRLLIFGSLLTGLAIDDKFK